MKIIKKYQNRRMYDVSQKKYITLDKLQELVIAKQDLKIIDVKSSEDITKQTLIQIILEGSLIGLEKFSNENLVKLIMILSGDKKNAYNNFLQESTDHFIRIKDTQQNVETNEDRLSTNKLTKFWQSITGSRNE
jgi:polyhydroxyalkanoate synthesis repressor PhaR